MNCAAHPDIAAVAFCRTCGKPLCGNCTRDVRGVVYCEPCLAARLEGTVPAVAFVPPQPTVYPAVGMPAPASRSGSGPNPTVAGILAGFFPFGVGAVYCSQYAKGLAHLLIFALLIFGSDHAGKWDWLFGIGIAFFYVYQIIDAVRTARALQEGQPAPDPMGLGQTFSMGEKFDSGKVPVGAVILIGLGVLFLLHTMGIMEYGFERFWPLILIFLGGWMFYRNYERSRRVCNCGRCSTRWLMGPAMVLTTGILLMLHTMDLAELDRTWPAWLLVVGIVKLLQSSASSEGHVGPLPAAPPAAAPQPPAPPSNPGSTPPAGEVRNV
jgi:Domain of unknown function (DUF5668)/B-box zinc finger